MQTPTHTHYRIPCLPTRRNTYAHYNYANNDNYFVMLICSHALALSVQWHIKQHPKDVRTKVGEDSKFFIVTSPGQVSYTYDWVFNDQSISDDNADYRGARTRKLVVLKSLSKHCGSYKCILIYL